MYVLFFCNVSCRRIISFFPLILYLGLLLNDDCEYPFWVLLQKKYGREIPLIRHVGVENETKILMPITKPPPKLIIGTKTAVNDMIDGINYKQIAMSGKLILYEKLGSND